MKDGHAQGPKKGAPTSWGGVSKWYDSMLEEGKDTYQSELILPNLLRLVGEVTSKTVLDLACGQGFFSRALKSAGAKVVGVDISPELVTLAKERTTNIEYHVSESHKLPFLKNQSVDTVTVILAIQNIRELALTFREVARVLKSQGKLILVLNHPAFRIPKASAWGFDEEANVQYRRVDSYLSESQVEIDMNPSGYRKNVTMSFHRPLQVYVKTLANAGFSVTRLEEWTSHKKSEVGKRKVAEDRARKEIPLFMMIEAKVF